MVDEKEWKIVFSKRACDDAIKISKAGLKQKVEDLIAVLKRNPYENPPIFEKLLGVENTYSRRINIQHRFVYEFLKEERTIIVRMLYKHYGK